MLVHGTSEQMVAPVQIWQAGLDPLVPWESMDPRVQLVTPSRWACRGFLAQGAERCHKVPHGVHDSWIRPARGGRRQGAGLGLVPSPRAIVSAHSPILPDGAMPPRALGKTEAGRREALWRIMGMHQLDRGQGRGGGGGGGGVVQAGS